MAVHFLPKDLRRWDRAGEDTLVLTLFSDERPLRGAAGLCDWRLAGRLSRLLGAGHVSGKRGETLMMPPGRRLPFGRLLLFGLGKSAGFDEELYRTHVRWMRDVLGRAGVQNFAMQAPGRATGLIAARRALELWLEEAGDAPGEVAFIDSPGAQKEMADLLAGARRSSRDSGAPS